MKTFSKERPIGRLGWWKALLAVAAIAAPLDAFADLAAVTTQPANLRAGPDRSFPLVAWLPASARVDVMGCIDGWRWCDVVAGANRGWVYARFLSTEFRDRPTVILDSGSLLGLPLVSFSVNTYWDAHYRNRSWWKDRSYWAGRPATWQRTTARRTEEHAPAHRAEARAPSRSAPAPSHTRSTSAERTSPVARPAQEHAPTHARSPSGPAGNGRSEANASHGGKPERGAANAQHGNAPEHREGNSSREEKPQRKDEHG
jgi:uncharacterized protein YraI